MEDLPDLVTIAETREIFEAELIALKLRSAGIDAEILDQSFKQEPLPNVRAFSVVRVMVKSSEHEDAERVLSQGEVLPEDAVSAGEEEES